jgi:hypothetical protein
VAAPITAAALKRLAESFDWEAWQKKLEPGFTQVYRDAVTAVGTTAAKAHDVDFDADDPFVDKRLTAYVGERITQLSDTSKEQVIATIQGVLEDAEADSSVQDLADAVAGAVGDLYDDFEQYRALRIARTESAIVYNHGNVLGGSQAGFDSFDVVDGTDDDECAEANGDVWSTDECLDDPIAHPNCVRAFFPHVDDRGDDEDDA